MDSLLVPLLKDKKGDITDKDNYRPIAITSVFSKIFERIILEKYKHLLQSNDNQFGFKAGHGTDLCVFTLKEIVDYYTLYSSNVYACFIDASKAFDRVNYWHLFSKLLSRGVPKLIVRILMTWYTTQCFAVKWGSEISASFTVSNGVRQGGVLSPILYNVFICDLSILLSQCKVGCFYNDVCMNHLLYADDSVLLAPSPNALQKLLNVCDKFATENELIFNPKKTKCICFTSKKLSKISIPCLYLNGNILAWVQEQKYLGVMLSDNQKDDCDVLRQMRSFYSRGNTLIRKFRTCSSQVKSQLFKTNCANLYCGQIWSSFSKHSYQKVKVAYNNIFRYLHGAKRDCSISKLFVDSHVDCFDVVFRKVINGFRQRISVSTNILISTIANSMFFVTKSNLFSKWKNVLFSY